MNIVYEREMDVRDNQQVGVHYRVLMHDVEAKSPVTMVYNMVISLNFPKGIIYLYLYLANNIM